jgi:uncharacterized protein (TIGR03437 family)
MPGRTSWVLPLLLLPALAQGQKVGQQTVPRGATRPPVILLNGWITGYVNSCPVATDSTSTFGNLASYLIADGVPVVYFFDNCKADPNQPIETLGNDFASLINSITYDDGTPVPQIDVVAHSMGGLIVRSYLAGLQLNGTLTPPADPRIRKLVLIATPNFGSFVAQNFSTIIVPASQSAEMIPGSALLWNLATWNQRIDDLRGVNAIAVAGNAGSYTNNLNGASLANASDGLVSLTSASLGFVAQQTTVTRIVPYCHVDPSAFTNASLMPYNCNAPGIANITSESHPTGQIVRSFLADNILWQAIGSTPNNDVYLSVDGGAFFALVNGSGSFVSDMTSVQWGTVTMQNGGESGKIFVTDFASGTGTYTAVSSSVGSINCGSITQAAGYFVAARCKIATAIISISPSVANSSALLVPAGSTITLTGAVFGALCNGCKVTANGQSLSVSSWKSNSITAQLPPNLYGLVTITVNAQTGNDSIAIMIPSPSSTAVTISGVSSAAGYQATIAPGSWVSIYGTNFASVAYTWQDSDFVNGQPPTSLQGVSVTVDGKPAVISYVSPTQINALVPDDNTTGSVAVQVTVNGQASNSFSAQLQQYSPAFFASNSVVTAQHTDYTLISASSPAHAGEVVILYGTGFGSAAASDIQLSIGGVPAAIGFAGLIEPGLEQFNVTIPAGVSGNAAVVASVGGVQTPAGITIPVQ